MNMWCLSEARASNPSVRLSRCWWKSTSSASGHISTVSYVNVQPKFLFAFKKIRTGNCESIKKKKKRLLSSKTIVCLFFFLLPMSQNTVKWFMLHSESKHCFLTCETANTSRYWTIVWLRSGYLKSLSAQLNAGSSQQIKISSWQSQANQVVKLPQSFFFLFLKQPQKKKCFLWTSRLQLPPRKIITHRSELSRDVFIVAIWKQIAWSSICHCKILSPFTQNQYVTLTQLPMCCALEWVWVFCIVYPVMKSSWGIFELEMITLLGNCIFILN